MLTNRNLEITIFFFWHPCIKAENAIFCLESRSVDVLMCFSGRRAIQSLKQRDCVVRGLDLTPLCGTTTISMVLIIIGHRWGFRLPGPLQNYEVNEQVRLIIIVF